MRISWTSFSGLIPKITPRNLPEKASQVSQNTWLAEYSLEPIKEPLFTATLPDALQKSIYLWRRGGNEEWLSWDRDVDVVRGPIADDQYSRIYFTDGTTLHMNLWDPTLGTPKVEVTDVSITPPAAPTITKGLSFDPSQIKAYQQDTISRKQFAFRSYRWTDSGTLELEFYLSAAAQYRLSGPPPTGIIQIECPSTGFTLSPAAGITPYNLAETDQSKIYTETIDITKTGDAAKFATLQVTALNFAYSTTDTVQTSQSYNPVYTISGYTLTVTINMNMARTSTQYQYYVQTTVDAYGQESPPSVVTDIVTWAPNDTITLTAASSGTKVRFYRSATGTSESNFYFVAEVNPGATYVDDNTDAQLSEVLPLIENPPVAMTGLVSMPGGFLAAFNGKDLYLSEPYLPYSWPTRYRVTMDFDIVGLAVSGNDLIVLTTGNPYYVSGTHPDIMSQSRVPVAQSCVSKRSIAFADKFVCYASPDGLCSISLGVVTVITAAFYTRDQWQALDPANMIGCVHDQRYIGWLAASGIIIDFKEPNSTLSTTDEVATGCYPDLENDQLYLIQGAEITDWRAGANNLIAVWRCKEFQNVQDALWTAAKVIADSYTNITFTIFADGVQVWSYTVTNSDGFRVPKFDRSARWSIQISTQDVVCEVIVASSMMGLRAINGIRPV